MNIPVWIIVIGGIFAFAGYVLIGIICACTADDKARHSISEQLFAEILLGWPVMFPFTLFAIWWHGRKKRGCSSMVEH